MKRVVVLALGILMWVSARAWAGEPGAAAVSGGAAHGGDHAGCGCPSGAGQPGSVDPIYHTHAAGSWMVSFEYMHVGMKGLRDGTHDVAADRVSPIGSEPYGYMMTPTAMDMDMGMLMLMYGATERLTVMAMANYQHNRMDMLMNMGMGNRPQDPMKTSGLGDVELRGLWSAGGGLVCGLGLSVPTGALDEEAVMMRMTFRAPYDMQLGSGTWDLKPSLTWSGKSPDGLWGWGGQGAFTWHPGTNTNGYHLGDSLKLTGWVDRALGPVRVSARLAYEIGRAHV
jgi:hypothetical protein